MSGINMTPKRRSELLAQLIASQKEREGFRGNRSLAEAAMRYAGRYMNQKKIDKLQEEESAYAKTNEKVIANAIQTQLGGSPQSVFGDIKTEPGDTNAMGFPQAPSKTEPANKKQQMAALAQALSKNPRNPALAAP